MSEERPRRTVGGAAALLFAGQFGSYAAGLLLGVIVARMLGPDGTGAFNVVASLMIILGAVASMGLGAGALYEVSRGMWNPGEAVRQLQLPALLLGALFGVIGVAIALGPAWDAFERVGADGVVIGVAALPFVLSWLFVGQVAVARGQPEVFSLASFGAVAVVIVLVLILIPPFGLDGAIAATTGASVVVAACVWLLWARRIPAEGGRLLAAAPRRLREVSAYGLRVWGFVVLQSINYRVDLLILSGTAAGATVGQYSVALNAALVLAQLPRSLGPAVTSRIAMLSPESAASERRMVTVKAMRHAILLALMGVALMAAGLPLIPLVYGEDFAGAVPLGYILIPSVFALAVSWGANSVLLGHGEPGKVFRSALLATAIALPLYVLLIPSLEGEGAALASSVSQLAAAALSVFYVIRLVPEIAPREYLPRREDLRDYRALLQRARRVLPGLRR